MSRGAHIILTILGNNGPYPAAGGACSGYLLSSDSGDTRILIDCGTGVLNRLLDECALDELDAVLLSHLHYDHMSDMLPMQYALQFHPRPHPLPVYAPEDSSSALFRLVTSVPCFDFHPVAPGASFSLADADVRVAAARHPVPAVGYIISHAGKTFGYTGDTNTLPSLADDFRGCDLLLADGKIDQLEERLNRIKAKEHESAN